MELKSKKGEMMIGSQRAENGKDAVSSDLEPKTMLEKKTDEGTPGAVFDPAVLAQLGDFRLRVSRLAAGMTYGIHRSVRMGVSTEFEDHRPWEEGDEQKFIDWRVFARTGKLFRRRFREDTNHAFHFLVDFSPSMNYAGKGRLSKLEYARLTASVMAYAVLEQRDLAGVTAANGMETVVLRASSGEEHWGEVLRFLEDPPFHGSVTGSFGTGSSRTDHSLSRSPWRGRPAGSASAVQSFAEVLNVLASACSKRARIFLFSDFFDVESWESILPQMKLLCAQGNEVTFFRILDADELEFPFESFSQFVSMEPGNGGALTLHPETVRSAYLENLRQWNDSLECGCRSLGIRFVPVDTRTPIHETVFSATQTR